MWPEKADVFEPRAGAVLDLTITRRFETCAQCRATAAAPLPRPFRQISPAANFLQPNVRGCRFSRCAASRCSWVFGRSVSRLDLPKRGSNSSLTGFSQVALRRRGLRHFARSLLEQ